MHEEQDVRKMGGLAKKMPVTYLTFLFGWLAIIGTPLFSGFFSKDEILWQAYSSNLGSKWLWIAGVAGAVMTAFYMTRLMALTFWGQSRVSKDVHVHESPLVMTLPLMILAVLSFVGGWIGIPEFLSGGHIPNILEEWLPVSHNQVSGSSLEEWATMATSVCLAGLSAYSAYYLYVKRPELLSAWAKKLKAIHSLIYHKYFIDELYEKVLVKPIVQFSRCLWAYFDVRVVDRTTYLLSDVVRGTGDNLKLMINGNVQQYALYILFGIIASLGFIFGR
jgi:NADH-quinone oxidoreductase subunit L